LSFWFAWLFGFFNISLFLFCRFLEYIILLKTTGTSRGTVDERLGFPFFLTLVPTLLSPLGLKSIPIGSYTMGSERS
jgi:hypothetical protein